MFAYTTIADDGRDGVRSTWRWAYTGAELLPYVAEKVAAFRQDEARAAAALAHARKAPDTDEKAADVGRVEARLRAVGRQRELTELLSAQLARDPKLVYNLALADLVYFNIDAGVSAPAAPPPDAD